MYIYIYLIFLIHFYIHYINIYRVTLKLLTQKWNIINYLYIYLYYYNFLNSNNIYINYKYYIFIILLNNIISI